MNWTLSDIKATNKAAAAKTGRAWWFAPDAVRFFDSKFERKVFTGKTKVFFVSSEQFHGSDGYSGPRGWSVRVFDPKKPDEIETLGKFQACKNRDDALEAARVAASLDT